MGDMSAAINQSAKPYTKSAKNILEWEGTGKIRILNDKKRAHTRPIDTAPQKELPRHDHDNTRTAEKVEEV